MGEEPRLPGKCATTLYIFMCLPTIIQPASHTTPVSLLSNPKRRGKGHFRLPDDGIH